MVSLGPNELICYILNTWQDKMAAITFVKFCSDHYIIMSQQYEFILKSN